MPFIDRADKTPYYLQIYTQIAHGIDNGLHVRGKRLPSIRQCAHELGVSNTTVELAYQKLEENGYIEARRGSGFYIAKSGKPYAPSNDRFSAAYRHALDELVKAARTPADAGCRYDFSYDAADTETFPTTAWARIARDVFFGRTDNGACLYNDCQGLYALRAQICKFLDSEYGIDAIPQQVLVMPTTRNLISAILGLFEPSTTIVSMENPGYNEVRSAIRRMGYSVSLLPLSAWSSWDAMQRALGASNLVFCTPASQFPTTSSMPYELRKQLVAWAHETGAYLIDDEYGSLFQQGGENAPSLFALDKEGRTIALGTFSNSFTPALCLSYAVLPPQLMLKWLDASGNQHPQVPWQTQAAMSHFMAEDHWRTHVRRLRASVVRKRDLLRQALERHMGSHVDVTGSFGSLYLLVRTRDGRSEDELVSAARKANVRVYPTAQYWEGDPPSDWRWILVGFAGIAADDIEPGIAALARAWGFE